MLVTSIKATATADNKDKLAIGVNDDPGSGNGLAEPGDLPLFRCLLSGKKPG